MRLRVGCAMRRVERKVYTTGDRVVGELVMKLCS